jgi:succinoglycan biosynthesis protein ExoO
MHDLFHTRADALKGGAARDSVAEVDRATEIALLGRADAVIAIQAAEADFVAGNVPGTEVLLAPMAAKPVAAPQPGQGSMLLFVGSNTAPNVVGLQWFLEEVWPSVRAAMPEAELHVAGTVARAFDQAPPGVSFLGLVDDLDALYREAAVFVSPLTFGSGLKIKLIEALAAGKAIVATSVTLQGVEEVAGPAIRRADAAPAFAEAVIGFLADPAARSASAARALDVARASFSSETVHAALTEWLRDEGETDDRTRANAA